MELEIWGYKFPHSLTIQQFENVMKELAKTLEFKLRFKQRKDNDIAGELTGKFTNLEFTTINEEDRVIAVNFSPYDVIWTTPYVEAVAKAYDDLGCGAASQS